MNRVGDGEWHLRFLRLAAFVAQWSKDPSTRAGAVLVRPDRTVASLGFNGFPRRVPDKLEHLNDREKKYRRIIHAEMNAVLQAHEPVRGCTLYTWPLPPCERCAVHLIQAGVLRVVSIRLSGELGERWVESCDRAQELFREAEVQVCLVEAGDVRADVYPEHPSGVSRR